MKISLIKSFIILLLFSLSIGCDSFEEKIIDLGPSEVLVYFDNNTDNYKVLTNGKHKFVTDYSYTKFSLENSKIQDRLLSISNDEKEVIVDLTYTYTLKEKNIVQIHQKYGEQVQERLIKPTIRQTVRDVIRNIASDSLNREEVKHNISVSFHNINDYSKLINSKSFIINELKLGN